MTSQLASGKVGHTNDKLGKFMRKRDRALVPDLEARFDGASFEAKLHELKHLPSGEIRMVLVIPESDRAQGTKMADAYAHALRVTVGRLRDER